MDRNSRLGLARISLIALLIVLINSCNFLETVDSSKIKRVVKEPDKVEFIGKWEADSFTYEIANKHPDLEDKKIGQWLKIIIAGWEGEAGLGDILDQNSYFIKVKHL